MSQTDRTATNWTDDARDCLERYLEHVGDVLTLRGYDPKHTVDNIRAQVELSVIAESDHLVHGDDVRRALGKLQSPLGANRSKRLTELNDMRPENWFRFEDGIREDRYPSSLIWLVSTIAILVFFVLPIVILLLYRSGPTPPTSPPPVPGLRSTAVRVPVPITNVDSDIIGTWESVDFVSAIADFHPGVKSQPGELYLKVLRCFEDGRSTLGYSFSNGVAIELDSGVRAQYFIKSYQGEGYLFLPWLSGDVIHRGLPPKYYVLRKRSESYAAATRGLADLELPGLWESVDYVKFVEDFQPGIRMWSRELSLKKLELFEDGRTSLELRWADGWITHSISKFRAHYYAKEIGGTPYFFLPWPDGPDSSDSEHIHYYVLKKST